MQRAMLFFAWFYSSLLCANPYPDPLKVARNEEFVLKRLTGKSRYRRLELSEYATIDVLRVDVAWQPVSKTYSFVGAHIEASGTQALLNRAPKLDVRGSFQGVLIDSEGQPIGHDSVGIGAYYRHLSRAATFRFPIPSGRVVFAMKAEDPVNGQLVEVLKVEIDPASLSRLEILGGLEVRELKPATVQPALIVVFFAEGFQANRKTNFFESAKKAANVFVTSQFPKVDQMEFRAVFAPSNKKLGNAQKLGMPIAERDSFLGMYFPYWSDLERWYHVVYPTREVRYRDAIGQVAYDYPVVLVDDNEYWGVGNFNELTGIPTGAAQFSYLLMHEFGHYMGLNEEYEGGGPTELAFAPGIDEPWSPNITFHPQREHLKWSNFVGPNVPLPTTMSYWSRTRALGAYVGGYGDSLPRGASHKPGFSCTMSSTAAFCAICKKAINDKIDFDLGVSGSD